MLPLMRELHDHGALTGPPLALFAPRLPDEELYDTQADPHEIQNLADSGQPEHRDALIRLRAALDVWLTETGDLGAVAGAARGPRADREGDARLVRHPGVVQALISFVAARRSRNPS